MLRESAHAYKKIHVFDRYPSRSLPNGSARVFACAMVLVQKSCLSLHPIELSLVTGLVVPPQSMLSARGRGSVVHTLETLTDRMKFEASRGVTQT